MAKQCASNCYSDVLQLLQAAEGNAGYSLSLYPNFGTNQPMYIFVHFLLVKLLELMNSGSFAVAGTLVTFWYDSNLAWHTATHNNVSNLEVQSAQIWKPSLILVNSVSKMQISLHASSQSTVDYDGKVTTVIPKIFNATCPIDITYFPFDTQKCTLTVGNTDLGRQQSETIVFWPIFAEVDTEMFTSGGEFSFVGSNVTSGFKTLEGLDYWLPVLSVELTFKRNPTYYLINVAAPCVMLLFSSGLIFFIPSDNTIKIAMACSLMIALYVLQQSISRVLPTTPTMPLLATGIMIELGLGYYSVLCAVVTVTLRALQPPLCPGCVKLINSIQRVFCCTPDSALSQNQTQIDQAPDATVARPATSLDNTRSHRLADTVTTLVQTLTTQADRDEAKKLKRDELSQQWKILDFVLNLILFSFYLTACVISSLKYLLCIGFLPESG